MTDPVVRCPDCGCQDKQLQLWSVCFTCQFWADQFATPGGLIINGRHHRVGAEPPGEKLAADPKGYGCYGHGFRIRLLADGSEIVTHNLWDQGDIPARLIRPDNAVFVAGPVPKPAPSHWHAEHLRRVDGDWLVPYRCTFDRCGYLFRTEREAVDLDGRIAAYLDGRLAAHEGVVR